MASLETPHSAVADRAQVAKGVLRAFFSAPNGIAMPSRDAPQGAPGSAAGVQVQAELLPALRYFAQGHWARGFVLPFQSKPDAPAIWFACAQGGPAVRALRAELEAFLGPSFVDFDAYGDDMDEAEAFAGPLLQAAGLHHVRFRATKKSFETNVVRYWAIYWHLIEVRPERAVSRPRTLAQLRADYDRALIARNDIDAQSIIAAFREQHGLSAENRAFLEIRLSAAFGRWEAIAKHRLLPHLIQLHLPPETYGDIQEALYELHLRSDEQASSAHHLLKSYEQDVKALVAPMMRQGGASLRPAVFKIRLLNELLQPQPSAAMCKELLDGLSETAFGDASGDIRARVASLQVQSGFDLAQQEMLRARYGQAYPLLWELPDSAQVLVALLRCAKEIADPVRARTVVQRLQDASFRDEVKQAQPRLLQDVERIADPEPEVPSWTARVVSPDKSALTPGAVQRWREIVQKDAREALKETDFASTMAQQIEELVIDQPDSFETLYPIWFEWVIERCPPESRYLPVYLALIESLRARDRFGESDLELLRQVALHIAKAGPNPAQYLGLIDHLLEVLKEVRSPSGAGWALEVADALAVAPCRDTEARARWFSVTQQICVEYVGRLRPAHRAMLELLSEEAGLALPALPRPRLQSPDDAPERLSARILVYSLDGSSVQRAVLMLRDMYPQATVDGNGDEVCTPRLRSASGSADWIVFVSAVATHQAFFCIKAALRREAKLLQVDGTGTTRIVERVVREFEVDPITS
ncbi:protein DpdD [Variovorax sp. LT1P1]|uniref:protein DpdD n=1 Tax=Variovorax sp. LT1P1 TaxID=3443730 RepID=UPI003F452CCF